MEYIKSIFAQEEGNFAIPTTRGSKHDNESKGSSKEQQTTRSTPSMFIALFLYIIASVAHCYVRTSHLKRSEINVFHIWVQSAVALIILWVYNYRQRRKQMFSFLQQMRRLKAFPAMCSYLVFIAIDGTNSNGFFNTSGGKEVHQLGMAVCPLCVIIASTWYNKNSAPTKAMIVVAISSVLMMVVFCSEHDQYIPYKITFTSGLCSIFHGISLALFALNARSSLQMQEVSIPQLAHSINLGCLVFLPFVLSATGELGLLFSGLLPSRKNAIASVYGICLMGLLQLLKQVTCLYLLSMASPLMFIATRGLAWIPVTLVITFAFKVELLVSSFEGFFIAAVIFFAALMDELMGSKT